MAENDGGCDYVEKMPMILNGGTFLSSSSPISWHSTKCEPGVTCSSMISNLHEQVNYPTRNLRVASRDDTHVGSTSPICAAFSKTTAPL